MLVSDPIQFEVCCDDIHNALENSKDGIIVTIKENKRTRSTLQNSFYWEGVNNISKFMINAGAFYMLQGLRLEYTTDTVHAINKAMFSISTTTKLSVREFIDYIDSINAFWLDKTNGNCRPLEPVRKYINRNKMETMK